MPRSRCSSLSCQTVLPEHEHTVLSSTRLVSTILNDYTSTKPAMTALTVPHSGTSGDDAHKRICVVLIKLQGSV
jgi:hypothetical protein